MKKSNQKTHKTIVHITSKPFEVSKLSKSAIIRPITETLLKNHNLNL